MGLGKYTSNTNIKEVGGYLNLIYHNESYGDWILGYGAASVVNKEDVVNYSYNTTTQKITENGILNNSLTRLYWSFPLSNSLSLAFETSYFNTKRKVASLDKVTEALSFESGFLYKF